MTCLLCRRNAAYLGLFLPDRPEKFGGRRVHSVPLCRRCVRKGKRHWTAKVEAELARRAALGRD